MVDEERKNWVELYQAALLETDPEKVQQLILEAQKAVQLRIQELLDKSNEHREQERQALTDALQNLRVMRDEKR